MAPSVLEASPATAAQRLLEAEAARVEMAVRREKRPTDPVETLLTGSGRIEPAAGHGQMRYDLTGLFTIPDASPPSNPTVFDLTWTPDDLWARADEAGEWQRRTRDDARESGGLLGRLPDEMDGLLRLLATSGPDQAASTGTSRIDGRDADSWIVTIPIEELAADGVPADAPDAETLRRVYGIDALPIEVLMVDGQVRRLQYAFAREEAPYGGPDRTTTTYDFLSAASEPPIELPD
jgi:hypothetical protein